MKTQDTFYKKLEKGYRKWRASQQTWAILSKQENLWIGTLKNFFLIASGYVLLFWIPYDWATLIWAMAVVTILWYQLDLWRESIEAIRSKQKVVLKDYRHNSKKIALEQLTTNKLAWEALPKPTMPFSESLIPYFFGVLNEQYKQSPVAKHLSTPESPDILFSEVEIIVPHIAKRLGGSHFDFWSIEFPIAFKETTILLPPQYTIGEYKQLQLPPETTPPEFYQYYSIFSSHPLHAQWVLSPYNVEQILFFQKFIQHPLFWVFRKGKLFIATTKQKSIWTEKNLTNPEFDKWLSETNSAFENLDIQAQILRRIKLIDPETFVYEYTENK